jgi:hypothetical protein
MDSTRKLVFAACAALLAACSSQAPFAPAGPPVAPIGSDQRASKVMSVQITRGVPDAKYVKIFDNLAALPSGKYWGGIQTVIVGGDGNSKFPDNQLAGAFTPSGNHTATLIEVAAVSTTGLGSYGSSGFTLTLNQDDKGIPGKALLSAQLPGLPSNGLGLCCALVTGTIPSGIALRAGQQYWIVLSGQSGEPNDAAGWTMDATDQLHPFLDAVYCAYASTCGQSVGWHTFAGSQFGTGLAFAVMGSN